MQSIPGIVVSLTTFFVYKFPCLWLSTFTGQPVKFVKTDNSGNLAHLWALCYQILLNRRTSLYRTCVEDNNQNFFWWMIPKPSFYWTLISCVKNCVDHFIMGKKEEILTQDFKSKILSIQQVIMLQVTYFPGLAYYSRHEEILWSVYHVRIYR